MKMNTDQKSSYLFSKDFWNVQPGWLRWVTILIALPAWLVIMLSVLQEGWSSLATNIGLAAISVAAVLQLGFFIQSQSWHKK